MSIRNLKDGSKKPWLCECYPQGRTSKRIRKRFATKGEEVCLATGARIRESIYLKGSNVTKFRITYNNTKGKRNRTVPISEELYNQIYKPTNDRLFTCGYSVAYKWLTKALPHLPERQATHVLRHTFASHFMSNGGNV